MVRFSSMWLLEQRTALRLHANALCSRRLGTIALQSPRIDYPRIRST